jgi:hypothetical protein
MKITYCARSERSTQEQVHVTPSVEESAPAAVVDHVLAAPGEPLASAVIE